MSIRGEERDENSSVDSLSADLDQLKGILKHNSVSFCVRGKWSLRGIHYSIWFLLLPRSANQNMYDTRSHVGWRRQRLLQTPVHLLLFSVLDCRESSKAQSSKSSSQNTQKPVLFSVWVFALTWLKAVFCACVITAALRGSYSSPFFFFLPSIASAFLCPKKR